MLKFLISVNWSASNQRDQAAKLLASWAEISVDQALPLLSGFFSINDIYTHMRIVNPINPEIIKKFKMIRNHAVESLKKANDKTIELLML